MRMRGYDTAGDQPKAGPPATPAAVLASAQAAVLVPAPVPGPATVVVLAAAPTQSNPSFTHLNKPSISQASPADTSKASPKHHLKGSGPSPNPAAREAMRPPKYGGYSKRDQLGSVNDSWGAEEATDDGVHRLGLFQVQPEPPSPPTSPFP